MLNGKKVMALIPARGGSKGIKRKNVKDLCGKPLIAYTILAAKQSCYIDGVYVSTEDMEIAEIAKRYGAEIPFLRPMKLAEDDSTTLDVVIHAVNNFINKKEWDALVLLQPTQPLRTVEDIDKTIEFFYQNGRKSTVSISEVNDSPVLMRYFDPNGELRKLLDMSSTVRRQDMPKYYRVNGAVYINAIEEINENTSFNDNQLGFIMEQMHSVDIDEEKDLYLAKYYIEKESTKIEQFAEKLSGE